MMAAVELLLSAMAALANAGIARGSKGLWIGLTAWSTLSLSRVAADAVSLFEWLPGVEWFRASGVLWFVISVPLWVAMRMWTKPVETDLGRRRVLAQSAAVVMAPGAGIGYAIRRSRQDAEIRECTITVPDLPADLDGLRLVQISDIHLSSFFSRDQLRRVVDQANDLRADLALVTGDLITAPGDPLDEAIEELSRLRADRGVLGCLGNHEIVARSERETVRMGARCGMRFLRQQAECLHFGCARLNIAGVDYQRKQRPYLTGTESLRRDDAVNLLLSHNPDVFPVAAAQGWDVTVAGHTHGGQITLEYLHPSLNPARFYTPFTYGLYQQEGRSLFVTSGLGTVGIPARLGTQAEIALLRLARA